ncbi:MNS1.2 family protein [Megaselia abdita]
MSNYDLRQKSHLSEILRSKPTEGLSSKPEVCWQVQEDKRQIFLEQKRRQQLRAENQDLRELERKLRCAYVTKSLALQKQEQAERRMKDREELKKEFENQERIRLKDLEIEKAKNEIGRQKQEALRKELQDQIMEVNFERNKKYQEFLIEKKRIDEIIRKIHEEEIEEVLRKKEKKELTRFQLEQFKRQKEELMKVMKLRNDEENKRIREIIVKREEEARKLDEVKRRARWEQEEISKKLGLDNLSLEEEQKKRRDLMEDLLVEEFKAKEDIKYREELEAQIRKRISISVSLEKYMEEKRIKREVDLREHNRLSKEEQIKFREESERLERLDNEERIKSRMQRSKDLNTQLETRKQEHENNIRKQIEEWAKDVKDKEKRNQIIEDERIRILQEHAKNLIGFLPQGILRDSDREFLELPPKH